MSEQSKEQNPRGEVVSGASTTNDQKPERLSVRRLAAAKALPEEFLRAVGLQDTDGVGIRYKMSDGSLVPRQREEAIVSYGPKRRQEVGYIALANGESDTWYHAIPALGDRPRNTDVNLACPRRQI